MFSIFLLTLAVAATYAGPGSYVVVTPSKFRPGMDLTMSVNILNATSPVTVTFTLGGGQATASGTFTQGRPGTVTMKVPDSATNGNLQVEGSGGLTFKQTSYLSMSQKKLSTFIQTNKGTYKPGDTVKFRALSVHADLSLIHEPMDLMIFDAEGNRIKQWLGAVPDNGVVAKQLTLSSQPVLGNWKVRVKQRRTTTDKEFAVAEYVLPKFEVTVEMPSYAVTSDSDVTLTVRAKYTYGKPVKGKVNVAAKLHTSYQHYNTPSDTASVIFTTQVPLDGAAKVTVPMSTLTQITKNLDGRKLTVIANVSEDLTGNQMTGVGEVKLYSKPFKMEFLKANPTTFKPGLKYTAYLLLTRPDGQPYGSGQEQVEVTTTLTKKDPQTPKTTISWWRPEPTITEILPAKSYTAALNGLVEIPLDVPSDVLSLFMTAKYQGVSSQLSLKKSHSPSDSYLQLVKTSSSTPKPGDTVSFEFKSTQPVDGFVYQVMSRGTVVTNQGLDAQGQMTFTFAIPVTAAMAPNARIVAYFVRDDGEIVTDSVSFDVTGVFTNQVSVGINQTQAEPGQSVKVTVTSDPNSYAHLLAIDQSQLLLRTGNDITAADVSSDLGGYDTVSKPVQDQFIWWGGTVTYSGIDAREVFQSAGVNVLTDGLVYKYVDPHPIMPIRAEMAFGQARPQAGLYQKGGGMTPQSEEPKRIRSDFSEVWMFEKALIGANGSASIVSAVPDTITSWVVSAFAVNNLTGFGVAPTTAKLKTFKPFFISLNLPYSVTRGEQVALQAIVFNYMNTELQVRVTLSKSDNFFNIFVDSNGQERYKQAEMVQDVLVKAGEAKSVYFPIVAADLGKIDLELKASSSVAGDAIRRQLLVEAEGVPKEYNVPVLVDLTGSGTKTFQKTVDLTLPPTVVMGSELTRVTVVGDMMGPSIAGLDSLLRMPTGCGEQTMIGLAPDVYVTDYLTAINKLDGETADKALGYMESGYQRELTYKHTDHSFSAFGDRDNSGSMWLTAFVSRVFHQARRHIDVDDDVIKRAINWMISKQNANGSFPEPGRVIHKSMQGNAAKGTGLSLFVLISLLENQDLYSKTGYEANRFNSALQKALSYLEQEVSQSDDIYTLALASYAFQLASSQQTQTVLAKLEQKATVKDGLKYWTVPDTAKTSSKAGSWHAPKTGKAIDTEVTAYVLLTYAAKKDLVNGRQVLQWVSQQRNPNGGFSSTQDTVVALNALSEMARLTYSDAYDVQISARLNSSLAYGFHVNSTNALVLQSQETKSVPAQVQVDATGSGMALLQVSVYFNVESEVEDQTFDLSVQLMEDTLNRLTIRTCARWLGEGSASGMAVQEVGIPSGFDIDSETVPTHSVLKRFEFQNKKLVLYFDEISTSDLCLDFVAERTGLVAKSQAVAVRVFDYYEPGNQMTTFYQSQVLKGSSVCDVCKECDNCAAVSRRR